MTRFSKSDYNRQYRLLFKDEIASKIRSYRLQNRLALAAKQREYHLRNKEQINIAKQEYYLDNKETMMRKRDKAERAAKARLKYISSLLEPNDYSPHMFSWKTSDQVRAFFDSIAPRLQITDPTDWYRISRSQILELGGTLN